MKRSAADDADRNSKRGPDTAVGQPVNDAAGMPRVNEPGGAAAAASLQSAAPPAARPPPRRPYAPRHYQHPYDYAPSSYYAPPPPQYAAPYPPQHYGYPPQRYQGYEDPSAPPMGAPAWDAPRGVPRCRQCGEVRDCSFQRSVSFLFSCDPARFLQKLIFFAFSSTMEPVGMEDLKED